MLQSKAFVRRYTNDILATENILSKLAAQAGFQVSE